MVALTFQSSGAIDIAQTTYDFGALANGAEDANKNTVVGVAWRDFENADTLASATINGVSATIVKQVNSGAGTFDGSACGAALLRAATPTGTTAQVVCTFADGIRRCQIAILTTTDPVNWTPFDDAQHTSNATHAGSFQLDLDLDLPSDGCAIAVCAAGVSGSNPSWASFGLTEVYDASNSAQRGMVAIANDTAMETAHGVQCIITTGTTVFEPVGLSVSFAPAVHELTATGVDSGTPSVGAPTLGEVVALAATGVSAGAPSVGAPTLALADVLGATGVSAGVPTVGTPALALVSDDLTAASIASGAPTAGTPALGQEHALGAVGIASGAPSVGAPTLTQEHALDATDVSAGSPTVGAPTLAEFVPGVDVLTALSIAAGTPSVGIPLLIPQFSYDQAAPIPPWFRKEEWRVLTGLQSYSGPPRFRRPARPPRPKLSWVAENIDSGVRLRLPRRWWDS